MHRTQIMSDGQERQTFKQWTLLIAKKASQPMVKGKTIYEYFRLKVEEYLRTASFKSYLLVVIKKKSVPRNHVIAKGPI